MSTVSGEESVRWNPVPRRTRPGLRGRRLVVMCANEHPIPKRERIALVPWAEWACAECGTGARRAVWVCAPLWREAWEWILWIGRRPVVREESRKP